MNDRGRSTLVLSPAARREDLRAVLDFIDGFCSQARADGESTFALRLAVEEAFLNIVGHGYGPDAPGPVELSAEQDGERLIVTIDDRAKPFAPEQAPRADRTSEWEARPIGGLGWHLIKSLMDDVRYESRADRVNRLTLVRAGRRESRGAGGES